MIDDIRVSLHVSADLAAGQLDLIYDAFELKYVWTQKEPFDQQW
jgi:hypothetical protein